MNRSNYSNLSDPSMAAAVRTAGMARSFVGALLVGGVFAVAALTACQPQRASVSRSVDAGVSQSSPREATDASLDTQLRLDPAEIQFYSQNIHG
jgi:hypothetical protein